MLNKTDKGRQELSPGNRTLGQRERAILLMADGHKTGTQLAQLFHGEGRRLIQNLLQSGHLQSQTTSAPHSERSATPTAQKIQRPTTAPKQHGESFTGTRSLATARMFLFDLSERLFAPRDQQLAQHYRSALREARDGVTMLKVGREIITRVEAMAGSERADGISERLAKLLPEEVLGQTA